MNGNSIMSEKPTTPKSSRARQLFIDFVIPVFAFLLFQSAIVQAYHVPTGSMKGTIEIGDLLFVAVNLARHHKVDAEDALRAANTKFEKRFRYIETQLKAAGKAWEDSSLEEMEALWVEAKSAA